MRKNKKNKCVNKVRSNKLEKHNAYSYIEDIDVMGKIYNISKSQKDWIELTRYELQSKANVYEKMFAEYLINHKIEFIHQAPYVIDGKIYFLDFYLKKYNKAIELDGQYHQSMSQRSQDHYRDSMFKSIKINTIRISNENVKSDRMIKNILELNHIK